MPESLAKVLVLAQHQAPQVNLVPGRVSGLLPKASGHTRRALYARDWPARSFISLGPPRWAGRVCAAPDPGLRKSSFTRRAPPLGWLRGVPSGRAEQTSRAWRCENLSHLQPPVFSATKRQPWNKNGQTRIDQFFTSPYPPDHGFHHSRYRQSAATTGPPGRNLVTRQCTKN